MPATTTPRGSPVRQGAGSSQGRRPPASLPEPCGGAGRCAEFISARPAGPAAVRCAGSRSAQPSPRGAA